jgi:hypothetical protein
MLPAVRENTQMTSLREWQTVTKNPANLIVQASSTDGRDAWQPFPIGMQFNYAKFCYSHELQRGNHDKLALLAVATQTDRRRRPTYGRPQIVDTCERLLAIKNQTLSPEEYYTSLPSYKFVVSPEGNGIDCHRHYEALLAGCIPIVEYHPGIVEKYGNCPILYTQDYSEITPEYLEATYRAMLDQPFDFSRLFLGSYEKNAQEYIKHCGNVWMLRCTNLPFYG